MSQHEIMQEMEPMRLAGDVAACVAHVEDALRRIPRTPFHVAAALGFTNPPAAVARRLSTFLARQLLRFPLAALYAAANGFCINPDRWFFDVFGYRAYGGHEDYDWLSDWQSEDFDAMTLTGMEDLQAVYASDAFGDDRYREACDLSDLIVVTKFQRLIRHAAALVDGPQIPILATAHDYDFICECKTGGEQGSGTLRR